MRSLPLHSKIFIAMVLGAVAGGIAQATLGADQSGLKAVVEQAMRPAGQVFLRLIFMVVIPLLFSALVLGVMEIGDPRKLGRIGLRALGFTVLLSGIAVGLALFAVNSIRPGDGFTAERREEMIRLYGRAEDATKNVERAKEAKGIGETILNFIPENPIEEAAKPKLGGVLALMVFAVLFGVALASIEAEKALPVTQFLEGLFAVSQRLIEMAMKLAPIGVFALMFSTAATLGVEAFVALGKYAALVLVVLALHLFGTYSLVLRFIARRNPLQFFRQIREVMVTAFATSSSNATLPTALRVGEENVGIPRKINSFVLTVGATANQNGTALFEGITVLFLAQVFGVSLTVTDQLTVIGLAILAGVGTAGVPGGAWPMIAAICSQIGVPPGAIALCLGIDRLLDMSRTVVNVVGDLTIAACVAEGEPDERMVAL